MTLKICNTTLYSSYCVIRRVWEKNSPMQSQLLLYCTAMTKAAYKRKGLFGLRAAEIQESITVLKSRQQAGIALKHLSTHISVHKQEAERWVWNGTSLLKPRSPLSVTYFLQQGHTSQSLNCFQLGTKYSDIQDLGGTSHSNYHMWLRFH